MMTDPAVWKMLNPTCSIEEHEPLQSRKLYKLTAKQREEEIQSLKSDGYCYIPALIGKKEVQEMLSCVRTLIEKDIPPVYCFVYDIFWQLILDLHPVLSEFLTVDYLTIANAWTWHVDGKKLGFFPPHRDLVDEDFIDEEGMPTLFSLWIPLTDVTTKSSCMYVLPGSLDPEYPEKAASWRRRWLKWGHAPWKVNDLVNIRALPAPAGTFMGWNAGVMHWGSKPHPNGPERISIGYYFHSPKAVKRNPNLLDLKKPFPLAKRLEVIFDMMRVYGQTLKAKV
ncbi:MAG: phytanoyl-CoA dioxygenase family protein [Verrucomicrobia bacterium]|nr:phytanoyl-CoA dioxygenase family protein [Verrucomicrobiota bacterium]